MRECRISHHFSLEGTFPRYLFSIDSVGNRWVEIERMPDLCSSQGRIATSDFIFHDRPKDFFGVIKKLALCFEYLPMRFVLDMLGCTEKMYTEMLPDNLLYPDIDGLIDIYQGPAIMYLSIVLIKKMKARTYSKKHEERIADMGRELLSMVEEACCRYARYASNLLALEEGRRHWTLHNRALIDLDHRDIPQTSMNGITLVLKDDILNLNPGYLDQYSHNLRDIREIGHGVSLVDFVCPMSNSMSSWYEGVYESGSTRCSSRNRSFHWGPLYPALLFPVYPEAKVVVIDSYKLPG